jgi:hypothetical protein
METWAIVTLVLGSSAISALLTFFITKMQVSHSDKRFEKEHERTITLYQRERQREVRSEPLLKLRNELAVMATKLEKLAKQGKSFTVPNKTREQEKEALDKAEKDWNNYMAEDYLEKVLYSQFDAEIVNRVREIRNKYLDTYDAVVTYEKELSATEFGKAARAAEEEIRPKVAEVQELINKRLEEL